ncbi:MULTISPECIES: class I SAM-dependent methyltransferase [unclassified Sphingobium]|uniref:class I SAM-dependent methyltransferase n=1 Tax=unclassified Sphingobium TaxID=2611147 RepID=UPI0022245DCD|nr:MULTISPECIES: class I SAM-dependent methyltransferase [unclassified Sphingobium]MCW2412253.1 tRNA (cmo5U34)-methyltransferase [Sphingobium sp. B8D3D]MCW2415450.1 tRNA (cmo5U34)-methyltransferase [Sphingobium sp. B8D3A]
MTTHDAAPDETVDPDMFIKAFDDPAATARYWDGPRRFVPGLDALHRMTGLLLAERAPSNARVLVLGAGGGMELRALAEAQPNWRFVGVDPAGEMLKLAERQLGPLMARVKLVHGLIDDAPDGPFDAAVCLLTLHFLDPTERTRTVQQIHRRLRAGAPFVAAHSSFPQDAETRDVWLDRYAAYPKAMGADPADTAKARAAVAASLHCLSPDEDEAILRAGGFADVALFYAAFTWRGWVGHA